jgi:hypothetical protein
MRDMIGMIAAKSGGAFVRMPPTAVNAFVELGILRVGDKMHDELQSLRCSAQVRYSKQH